MQIAPGIDRSEWLKLKLDNSQGEDWDKAIEIFELRIRSRYLEPVDLLVEEDQKRKPTKRRYGFTVLAIDCLLMETLQAFKEGLENTVGISNRTFKNYLLESPNFSQYFKDDTEAESFYKDFRCGILHQAEIMGPSRLWSVGDLKGHTGEFPYINRTKIHECLKNDIEQYINDLKDQRNTELRMNFVTKMNFIARKNEERA
jgi:hypothetical protein